MSWFALQIDRDFENIYGEGKPRLYFKGNTLTYKLIDGVKYNSSTNTLLVKDVNGVQYTLDTEPEHELFSKTIYAHWKKVDDIYGKMFLEDRSEYEPWSYNSIKSLAIALGVYDEREIVIFYNKPFST